MEKQQHNTETSSSDEVTSFEDFEEEDFQTELDQEEAPSKNASFLKRFDQTSVWEFIRHSYISRILLILLAVWFGLKLVGKLLPSRSKSHHPKTASVLVSSTESDSQTSIEEKKGLAGSKIESPYVNSHNLSELTPNQLEARLTQIQASLDQLNVQISTLQNKLNGLEGRVTQLRDNIQPIQQWIQKQQALDKAIKREAVFKEKTSRPILYNLRAIQKGRAWISTQTGEELTVQEGDFIPNYGTVLTIDFINKYVKLSDGSVFGFNSNPALDGIASHVNR